MKQWRTILLPSQYGLFFTVFAATVIMMLLIIPGVLKHTGLSQYFSLLETGEVQSSTYTNYKEVSDQVSGSKFAADSSVFLFWSAAGLLLYAIVRAVQHILVETRDIVDEVRFARWRNGEIWAAATSRFSIQVIASGLLLVWISFVANTAIPLLITGAARTLDVGLPGGIGYGAGVFVGLVVVVHGTVVLIRAVLLRTRIFIGHALIPSGHDID